MHIRHILSHNSNIIMESAKDILFELRHKEKKISDLVRFLSIRCDETPNYSLLMGAGCSITSGIKSGTQLINDWKKEIIEYADDYDTSITSDEYFENKTGLMKEIPTLLFSKNDMIYSDKEEHLLKMK